MVKGNVSGLLVYDSNKIGDAYASFDVSGLDLVVG
jgi:hypothetical protein